METIVWTLGQHLVLAGGTTYWATDSNYKYVKSEHSRHRRDIFLLRGVEHIQVQQPNGHVFRRPTALCCEGICFLTIHNILQLDHTLPPNIVNQMEGSKNTCLRLFVSWVHTFTNDFHTYSQVIWLLFWLVGLRAIPTPSNAIYFVDLSAPAFCQIIIVYGDTPEHLTIGGLWLLTVAPKQER